MTVTLSDLEQQNPNIRSQMEDWQSQRAGNGENPMDWQAFRQHAQGIGAPDPGQEAPPEFMQSTAAATRTAFTGQQPQSQPQQSQWQQPQQPQSQQPQQNPALLEAIRIKNEYEAAKNIPTDKWLQQRGMTKAQLDAALALAAGGSSTGNL
jgi:hypothetical protein